MRIFVDMDGTMAAWGHIDTSEDLLQKGYYRNLPPYENVVNAVKFLLNYGIPVYSLSAYLTESRYALSEKKEWLDEFVSEIPVEHRLFCPCGVEKSDYIKQATGQLGIDDFLLDDYSLNLHSWEEAGGTGIKLMNGINGTKGSWDGQKVVRFLSGQDLADVIMKIIMRTIKN